MCSNLNTLSLSCLPRANQLPHSQSLWWRNGFITVGGRPLREIDLKWWRMQIGLVQQEPFLFNDTIYKNVEFGLIGTEWEDAELEVKKDLVKQACKEAFADEFISRLPEVRRFQLFRFRKIVDKNQGYSTRVGDAGIKLSGGQRQRLAIARSIVKRPKILILDEATSSIDVRGEQIVQAALEKVSKNRTTLVIAHRLATIQKADNIVVLRKGQVVQQGTHSELMAQEGGAYWTLATSQQLSDSDEDDTDESAPPYAEVSEKKSMATIATETTYVETVVPSEQGGDTKKKASFWRTFGLLLLEQKKLRKWYAILLISAICGGGELPLFLVLERMS